MIILKDHYLILPAARVQVLLNEIKSDNATKLEFYFNAWSDIDEETLDSNYIVDIYALVNNYEKLIGSYTLSEEDYFQSEDVNLEALEKDIKTLQNELKLQNLNYISVEDY